MKRGVALPRPVERDVPARHLGDAAAVRETCGNVSRPTMLTWRREKEFPPPVRVPHVAGELWDLRDVRAWLRKRAAALH